MTVLAKYAAYSQEGVRCGGGSLHMPEYLDWMDIEVKAEWFRYMGQGPSATHYILLESQGQEKLIAGISLTQMLFVEYKEREAGAAAHIDEFIREHGFSRNPRNQ